jgi:hypothetical protein
LVNNDQGFDATIQQWRVEHTVPDPLGLGWSSSGSISVNESEPGVFIIPVGQRSSTTDFYIRKDGAISGHVTRIVFEGLGTPPTVPASWFDDVDDV